MVKLTIAFALLVGACALFAEGPPENVCRTDEDCFRAQGEVCDLEASRCIQGDPGVIDATVIDAPADAGSDADVR